MMNSSIQLCMTYYVGQFLPKTFYRLFYSILKSILELKPFVWSKIDCHRLLELKNFHI